MTSSEALVVGLAVLLCAAAAAFQDRLNAALAGGAGALALLAVLAVALRRCVL